MNNKTRLNPPKHKEDSLSKEELMKLYTLAVDEEYQWTKVHHDRVAF